MKTPRDQFGVADKQCNICDFYRDFSYTFVLPMDVQPSESVDPYLSDYGEGFDDLLSVGEPAEDQRPALIIASKFGGPKPPAPIISSKFGGAKMPAHLAISAAPKTPAPQPKRGGGPPPSVRQSKSGGHQSSSERRPSVSLVKAAPMFPDDEIRRPRTLAPQIQVKAKARRRSRIPWSIRDWGIPQYDARDRSEYCWAYRHDQKALRRRIAETVLMYPRCTNYQFNRLLYNKYGARTSELNILFECRGIAQLTDLIFTYDLEEVVSRPGRYTGNPSRTTGEQE